jgi:hypothetical protein
LGFRLSRTKEQRSHASTSTSTSSSSANPEARQTPPKVPVRLQQKIDTIDLKQIKRIDAALHDYAAKVVSDASKGWQPDRGTTQLDKKFLPLIAEMENHRVPGLDLHVFDAPGKCHSFLAQKALSGETSNFRVAYRPSEELADHYIALDVRILAHKPPSIILYESAMGHLVDRMAAELCKAVPGAKIKVKLAGGQASHWDCVMFALHSAVKSFKTRAEFADLIHAGVDVKEAPMPVIFQKHRHSRDGLEGKPLGQAIVTKAQTGPAAETLRDRVEAFRTDRDGMHYSTSIEGFRMQEISRLAHYLKNVKPKLASSSAPVTPQRSPMPRLISRTPRQAHVEARTFQAPARNDSPKMETMLAGMARHLPRDEYKQIAQSARALPHEVQGLLAHLLPHASGRQVINGLAAQVSGAPSFHAKLPEFASRIAADARLLQIRELTRKDETSSSREKAQGRAVASAPIIQEIWEKLCAER